MDVERLVDPARTAIADPARLELARRIHDRVLQRLFVVSLVLEPDGPLEPEERARCREEVQRALAELRAAIDPAEPGPRAEGDTLDEELSLLRDELGDVPLVVDPPRPSVPAELQPVAQHFVAESVRNAVKHARPTVVAVRVSGDAGTLAIEVENDGAECGSSDEPGIGLRLLSAEAELCGGSIEFGAAADERWCTSLRLPLVQAA